jgi:hypothetical protein
VVGHVFRVQRAECGVQTSVQRSAFGTAVALRESRVSELRPGPAKFVTESGAGSWLR